MARASPALANFNAGELSPFIEGRTDASKYGAGCKRLENFIPTIQGVATRRGGRRYVAEVKDSTKRAWLMKFEFNTTEAFELEFGDGYVRFFYNHAPVIVSGVAAYSGATAYVPGDLVQQGGVNYLCTAATTGNSPPNASFWYPLTGAIYEIPSPYSAADLVSADGTFALRFVQSADVIYICHPAYQTRKLTRFGATRWIFSLMQQKGGPFKTKNISTTTVYAGAQVGNTTLTASAAIFTAAMVGSAFLLEEPSNTSQKPWASGTAYAVGARVRHDGKNYVAASAGTSGAEGPTHTDGTVFDGATVSWTYEDPGYGYALITGYTSPTQVTVTVVDALPALVVGIGNASLNWAFGAWSAIDGWPTHASFFRERLVLGRGLEAWLSVSGDFENFHDRDASGLIVTDSSFKVTLTAKQISNILWMEVFSQTSEALMIGTASTEFAIKSQTESQPFGPDNYTSQPVSTIGSRNVVPVRVGSAILFAQRSGRKLQDLTYDYYAGSNGSNDQTLFANHILLPQISQMAYQQEPFSVIYCLLRNGTIAAMTYSREQYENPPHGGWHRHPFSEGFTECIDAIPSDTRNELWGITQITVGGVAKRLIWYETPEFELDADQQDAFFVDLGATYDGAVATTLQPDAAAATKGATGVLFTAGAAVFSPSDVGRYIYRRFNFTAEDESGTPYVAHKNAKAQITEYLSGTQVKATITAAFPDVALIASNGWRLTVTSVSNLNWLEGKTVDVLGDGATHPQLTVSGGTITLQRPAAVVHIGIPMPARLQTMRLVGASPDGGTSQGKISRVPEIVIRFLQTLGMRIGASFKSMNAIEFRKPANEMDNAVPLFTGDKAMPFNGDWDTNPWVCLEQKDPLPATVVGIYPQLITNSRGS